MWDWQGCSFCSDGDGLIPLLDLSVVAAQLWLPPERQLDLGRPCEDPFRLSVLLLDRVGGWAPRFPFCRENTQCVICAGPFGGKRFVFHLFANH